jgi:hypothetical protein
MLLMPGVPRVGDLIQFGSPQEPVFHKVNQVIWSVYPFEATLVRTEKLP